jgi:hypothetical protein
MYVHVFPWRTEKENLFTCMVLPVLMGSSQEVGNILIQAHVLEWSSVRRTHLYRTSPTVTYNLKTCL